jgi:hypothetical protein
MKRFIILLITITAMLVYGCKSQRAPGAPYDAVLTATPTPHYNLSFTIMSTQTPLAGATVVLIYPDATRTVIGKTDTDGKVNFKVSDSGGYTANIKHTSIPGSDIYPIFNTYNVNNGTNDYLINVDTGSLTLVAQNPYSISYTAQGGDYNFYLKYTGTMKRKITASMGYGMWVNGVYDLTTFIPAYIDAPGTSMCVKITLPKYFHQNDLYPQFNFSVNLNTNVVLGVGMISAFNYYTNIYADWLFSTKTATAVTYDPYYGRISTTMQLFVKNIDITKVCMRVNKYEYFIGGQLVDHSYYSGTADYKINGYSADVDGTHCFLGASNFSVSLGYPGYSGSASTHARLTLDFVDRNDDSRIIQAVIENPY